MQRTSELSEKNGFTVHLKELSTFIAIKMPTTTVFVYISYSASALDA